MDRVGFRFFPGDDCADVLDEIDAAFFAFTSRTLTIPAGRALETQGGVAARTKASNVARLGAAFRTSIGGPGLRFGRPTRGPGNFDRGFGGGLARDGQRCMGEFGWCGRWQGGAGHSVRSWPSVLRQACACPRLRRDELAAHPDILVRLGGECGDREGEVRPRRYPVHAYRR